MAGGEVRKVHLILFLNTWISPTFSAHTGFLLCLFRPPTPAVHTDIKTTTANIIASNTASCRKGALWKDVRTPSHHTGEKQHECQWMWIFASFWEQEECVDKTARISKSLFKHPACIAPPLSPTFSGYYLHFKLFAFLSVKRISFSPFHVSHCCIRGAQASFVRSQVSTSEGKLEL